MKNVLVIDDDPAILEVVKLILEENDYIVKTGENGEVLRNMRGFTPDLILLDVLLSGEDGRDLAKMLKADQKTKKIPLVMLSAHPSAFDSSINAGANDFLPKPFDIDEFINVVKKYTKKNSI